jgi:hypothetical protein
MTSKGGEQPNCNFILRLFGFPGQPYSWGKEKAGVRSIWPTQTAKIG